jgi:hypothetical protein
MLSKLIKEGWWGGKPEKWEEESTILPLTDEQLEFFKHNKWVNVTDSMGRVWRYTRNYWNYEQWEADPMNRGEIYLLSIQPKTKVCNCCGGEL